MFSILVHGDGKAWEHAEGMSMSKPRFGERSGREDRKVNFDDAESLAVLENALTFLMYEDHADGVNTDVVRVGHVNGITVSGGEIYFKFKERGRLPKDVFKEHARLFQMGDWDFNRTHWAVKDGLAPSIVKDRLTPTAPKYDVALSFAGEDRTYVEGVAHYLKENGVEVFYDRFEEIDLWGKDLPEHLDMVYRTGAQYCVMFISRHYAEKVWTNHERKSALDAALHARREYILPVRLDETELPGVRPTVGYVKAAGKSPEEMGAMILKKLGRLE